MSLASVCRVCLSTRRLEIIANTQLQTIFEKITSHQLVADDGRPQSVCYMCHKLLQKCCKFVDLSRRAEKILSQLVSSGIKVTRKNLTKTCATIHNDTTLSVCKTTFVSIQSDEEASKVLIKTESEERKYEVKIDTEHLPIKICNIKSGIENNGIEAEPFDQVFVSDGEKGLDSSYVLPGPTTSQKQDVPVDIRGEKISDVNISKEKPFNQKSMLDADRDSYVSGPTSTEKQGSYVSGPTSTEKQGITKHKYPKQQNTRTAEAKLKRMTDITIQIKKTNDQKKFKTNLTGSTYNCFKCPKIFKQKAYLKRHVRTHTGEKPYACDICNHTFIDSTILKQHIRTHSGEAPYICHVCSKQFNQKPHLVEHIRTHTGEKPYACETCPYTFAHRSSLKRHMRTHSGEKPYICHKCSRQFSQISNLQKHIRTCKIGKSTRSLCAKCSQ